MIVEQLKELRLKHSLTQEHLAALLGVSFTTVNAWEAGKRVPQHSMRLLLERLFNQEELPSPENPTLTSGLTRSDAGFVSSIISYPGRKDDQPLTHGIGRWYGCLPSFFARDVVSFCATDLGVSGEALVNFCGSGTVPLEFGLAGIQATAIDINPAALILSHLKSQRITPPTVAEYRAFLSQAARNLDKNSGLHRKKPSDENLVGKRNQWIDDRMRAIFQGIASRITRTRILDHQIVYAAALLNISTDYCQIDKRCTNHYVLKSNSVDEEEFWETYSGEIERILLKVKELSQVAKYKPPKILLRDNRATDLGGESFDVVFAHPPYGTMINYYGISRVHQSILESIEFKAGFLDDSRLSMSKTKELDQSSGTDRRFEESIAAWVGEAYRLTRSGGHLVAVIGDGRKNGYLNHPHTEIIKSAESLGMRLKELFIWITENKSGMHVRRKGHHIDHNYVIVLEKATRK